MDGDELKNKVDEATGKVKEKVGGLTDNEDLRQEGRKDQQKANLNEAGRTIKDATKKVADDVAEAFDR